MAVIRPTDTYAFQQSVIFDGGLTLPANAVSSDNQIKAGSDITRAKMIQEANAVYALPVQTWRVHNTGQLLPSAAGGADDLYIDADNWATDGWMLKSDDANGTTVTQYAVNSFCMPPEYDAGETITLRLPCIAGVIPDTTKTIDLVAYEDNYNGGIGADLCATAAQNVTTSWANYDFTITPTTVAAGDMLIFRLAINFVDSGSGADVVASIGHPTVRIDIRG